MVLEQLGLKNGDIVTARKINVKEDVVEDPIIDPVTKELTPPAAKTFNEWFDKYKNPKIGKINDVGLAWFVFEATTEPHDVDDKLILGIFEKHSKEDPEKKLLNRQEWLALFYTAAQTESGKRNIRNNLANHFIRADFKKMSEIDEESGFKKELMPRFTMSDNQAQFNKLMDLLNRNDETSPHVWDLIRSLATNQDLYKKMLSFSEAKNEQDEISWEKFFEGNSMY